MLFFLFNKFKYITMYNIVYSLKFKYNWCLNKGDGRNFFYLYNYEFYNNNLIFFNEFNVNNSLALEEDFDDKIFLIDNLINFKLTSGFFKKDFNLSHVLIDKLGKIKYREPLFIDDYYNFNYPSNDFIDCGSSEDEYQSQIDGEDISNINNFNFIASDDENSKGVFKVDFSEFDHPNSSLFFKKQIADSQKYFDEDLFYDFDENYFNNYELLHNFDFFKKFEDSKTLDLRTKHKKWISRNRNILAYFIRKKIKRDINFNKFIKNFIKKPIDTFVFFFEFSIKNILLRSQLFFNEKDIDFFLENSYIRVNNKTISNCFFNLKVYDRISINFDKFYFLYYRKVINNINHYLTKLGNYHQLQEQKKYDYDKQQKTTFPKWVSHITYFKEDIPNFIEIDFLTLSMVILYKPVFYELNANNMKFINYFQRRLYNWKYII